MAAAGIEGATQWQIEKRNDETGEADWLGYAHLGITLRQFIRKFLVSMPAKGEPAATFYFTALDALGTRIGAPGKPTGKLNIPWNNEILLDLFAARQPRAGLGGEGDSSAGMVFALLQQQLANTRNELQQERLARKEEAARIDALKDAAYQERQNQGRAVQDDLSKAYSGLAITQKEMMGGVVDQVTAAANAERLRLQSTLEMEKMRLQAEADAKIALLKAESDARLAQQKIEADLRAKEIELKIQESKDAVAREQQRLDREDERRRAERVEERAREDQRRADERAAEDRRRSEAAAADREHSLALERLRAEGVAMQTQALGMQRDVLSNEKERAREHLTLLASIMEKQRAPEGGNKLGIIGEILDATGMTPGEALSQFKGMLGGTTLGTTIAQGFTDVLKEVVKRLPASDGLGPDDDDDDGDDKWVEEPPPRQIEARSKTIVAAAQVVKPVPLPKPVQRNTGPGLDAYLSQATEPEPDAVDPADDAEDQAAAASVTEALSLPQLKAARSTLLTMVGMLESEKTHSKWPDLILNLDDLDAAVALVSAEGLRKALHGAGADVEELDLPAMRVALIETGLFDESTLPESVC